MKSGAEAEHGSFANFRFSARVIHDDLVIQRTGLGNDGTLTLRATPTDGVESVVESIGLHVLEQLGVEDDGSTKPAGVDGSTKSGAQAKPKAHEMRPSMARGEGELQAELDRAHTDLGIAVERDRTHFQTMARIRRALGDPDGDIADAASRLVSELDRAKILLRDGESELRAKIDQASKEIADELSAANNKALDAEIDQAKARGEARANELLCTIIEQSWEALGKKGRRDVNLPSGIAEEVGRFEADIRDAWAALDGGWKAAGSLSDAIEAKCSMLEQQAEEPAPRLGTTAAAALDVIGQVTGFFGSCARALGRDLRKPRPEREPKYLWLDLETSGLDPQLNRILECAAVITDDELNEVAPVFHRVLCSFGTRGTADDLVREMHDKNGLWIDCDGSKLTEPVVMAELLRYIERHTGSKKLILAGSSVHFDRAFLSVASADLVESLSHRQLDAASLREMARDMGHEIPRFESEHRAPSDVRASIALAKTVRGFVKKRRLLSWPTEASGRRSTPPPSAAAPSKRGAWWG